MISNLRARPIEGHVADSAGNILRNAQITIKQSTPTGNYTVDLSNSDDNGYFITNPLPNGVYDIYESGTHVSRTIHEASSHSVQCFQASQDSYDADLIENFDALAGATTQKLNRFKAFVQIEPVFMNVYQYGSMYQLYDFDVSVDPDNNDTNELYRLANFFNFSANSRITTTRFDVEYFSPITPTSTSYKRVRWAGVPGIKFYKDSRLLLPLDYYSIVASHPKKISPSATSLAIDKIKVIAATSTTITISETIAGELNALSYLVSVGDILKLNFTKTDLTYGVWYGIILSVSAGVGNKIITLERWKTSRFLAEGYTIAGVPNPAVITGIGDSIRRIYAFDGMFSNIMSISDEANQRFTVTENNYSQNNASELYNYIDQYP